MTSEGLGERRVSRAQTRERGPPSVLSEIYHSPFIDLQTETKTNPSLFHWILDAKIATFCGCVIWWISFLCVLIFQHHQIIYIVLKSRNTFCTVSVFTNFKNKAPGLFHLLVVLVCSCSRYSW